MTAAAFRGAMPKTPAILAAILATLLLAPSASARPEGASEVDLDTLDVEGLERELLAIERELALVHRDLFTFAMAARELAEAGRALSAWRGHQAMAQRLLPDAPRDDTLSARLALHAHTLAIEAREPRGLVDDIRAFDRELAALD